MKKSSNAVYKLCVYLTVFTLLNACTGPLWQFPGGALSGDETKLDLTHANPEGGVIQLETYPADPYSVNVGYVVVDGNMYIDPTESRTWYQNIKTNESIRIRFDGSKTVHPAIAIPETQASVLQQFESDRHVLKLLPRPE